MTKNINKFDKKLKERCLNTYKFSNSNNSKFMLFLQKGVFRMRDMQLDPAKFLSTPVLAWQGA